MNIKRKILAISGSTRKGSSNESILKFIATKYQDLVEVELYDDIDKLPYFNPDLDTETPPKLVIEFRNSIANADGILICTPEYVFSLPGILKNAIEWNVSTTLFSNKPVAFIVASASGEKAFESLNLVLTTIESTIAEDSKLLIQGAKGKIGTESKIIDNATQESIGKLVNSLLKTIEMNGE